MTRLIIILCFLPLSLIGQTGGKNAFPFLDLPYNARAASLGRQFITAFDDDINTGVQNPASFNTQMDNSIKICCLRQNGPYGCKWREAGNLFCRRFCFGREYWTNIKSKPLHWSNF